jgi:hypothetical protein
MSCDPICNLDKYRNSRLAHILEHFSFSYNSIRNWTTKVSCDPTCNKDKEKFKVSTNSEAFLYRLQLHFQVGNKGQLRRHLQLEKKSNLGLARISEHFSLTCNYTCNWATKVSCEPTSNWDKNINSWLARILNHFSLSYNSTSTGQQMSVATPLATRTKRNSRLESILKHFFLRCNSSCNCATKICCVPTCNWDKIENQSDHRFRSISLSVVTTLVTGQKRSFVTLVVTGPKIEIHG